MLEIGGKRDFLKGSLKRLGNILINITKKRKLKTSNRRKNAQK